MLYFYIVVSGISHFLYFIILQFFKFCLGFFNSCFKLSLIILVSLFKYIIRTLFSNIASLHQVFHHSVISFLLSMESWAAAKRNVQLVWRCHQLLPGFLAKGHLPRVSCHSRQSRQFAKDKGDEMILEAVHRSPGICKEFSLLCC